MTANRPLKLLKVLLVNLLVLVVLLEITSALAYYVKTREFFYTRDKSRVRITKATMEAQFQTGRDNPTPLARLHPYFGYTERIGSNDASERTNNFGFNCSHDFPYKKTFAKQYVIGIFGGSVAQGFAIHEMATHALEHALKQSPYFADKELVILPYAAGGYKQPQQLLILNYFLAVGQQFDMVLNIDGFNETVVAQLNNRAGIDISMPAVHVTLPLIELANKDLSAQALSLSLKVLEIRKQLAASVDNLADCRTATCYTLAWMQLKLRERTLRKTMEELGRLERVETQEDSLVAIKRADKQGEESESYDRMVDIWANASSAMKDELEAKGIEYFHFIQPNQYYHTSRVFSEKERQIAFGENSPYRDAVEKGYPRLLSRVSDLQKSGEKIFSAVSIFDSVKDVIYIDDCCHYTKEGNDLFAKFIAEKISLSLK